MKNNLVAIALSDLQSVTGGRNLQDEYMKNRDNKDWYRTLKPGEARDLIKKNFPGDGNLRPSPNLTILRPKK